MKNITKFEIAKPAHEVFEAFVDPAKIGNFWFSTSSERWESGKTVALTYKEYNAELEIKVIDVVADQKIVFNWGPVEDEHQVTISLNEVDSSSTIIEVTEDGFKENDPEFVHNLVDNKEGWVYMLTCLKGYLENGVNTLRGALVKE
ncbi:SRPBCC family protein [Neobacillus cucumis]|uniref:SRPBCC family protein n=1 Tax=Neobacillus cucumis TaxID=1740721 RepID=UPI0018DF6539|nr:SRPBCC family protein [Neobacillus cucumis]MBI0578685.1 SRPBCC family protein [Neobacillus cucumis]